MPIEFLIAAVALAALGAFAFYRWRRRGPSLHLEEGALKTRFKALFGREQAGDEALQAIEEMLLEADVGPQTAMEIVEALRPLASLGPQALRDGLKTALLEHIRACPPPEISAAKPLVILLFGVNGVGKTTTLAKLAAYFTAAKRNVLAVAGDTFRAGAVAQLKVWSERVPFALIAQGERADPGAVLCDGLSAARARGVDVVLVDTAGRLHTKTPLIEELKKLDRVIEKFASDLRVLRYLVLDAHTGQNGLAQAKGFAAALPIDGIVLTKWDGSAKGGFIFSIAASLGLPLAFLGTGESLEDFQPFNSEQFVAELL